MSQSSFARRLLLPLIPLYRLVLAFRELRLAIGLESVRRLRFPVVSIGNLSTGGVGKTPLTIALARALKQRGLRVDVLSRGYGRDSQLAAQVTMDGTAAEFGDEPLLIAYEANVPVYVAPERYDAGLLAEADADAEAAETAPKPMPADQEHANQPNPSPGSSASASAAESKATGKDGPQSAQFPSGTGLTEAPLPDDPSLAKDQTEAPSLPRGSVHLLDDGFQHRQLDRSVNILLLNQDDWQDWLLPAGNLREPIESARRASVIAVPADEPELEAELYVWGWDGPVWRLHRRMEIPLVQSPIAAFCGIARPEQFFAGLESLGLEIPLQLAFPDHFTYTREVLEELLEEAREKEVTAIVTTAKDVVRLGRLVALFPKTMPLAVASLRVEIENQSAAIDWLMEQLR
ncbi:MAG: tetraacyldisaccharide 4'-kinase [Terracidiphilus sp.]|jgi:tetraacyldisaccharide 4'-kinase